MAAPNVNLGNLNKLLASVIYPDNPGLNINPPFLTKDGISWNPQGPTSNMLQGLTGGIPSPEPYVLVRVTIHLLKSIALSENYLQQIENNCMVGPATFYFDSPVMNPRYLTNCSILGVGAISANGMDPGMVVEMEGSWNINGALWP